MYRNNDSILYTGSPWALKCMFGLSTVGMVFHICIYVMMLKEMLIPDLKFLAAKTKVL